MIQKVVPVILRKIDHQPHLLVFRHPLAGIQIVKGTVEPNETLEQACLRELYEESGIVKSTVRSYLGLYHPKQLGHAWHMFYCETSQNLASHWTHYCLDDGGLNFDFFWHPLSSTPSDEWHPIFQDALKFIVDSLNSLETKN